MKDMKLINGIWWPKEDRECHPVVPGQLKDVDKAVNLCKAHTVCVQAGGNVGLWPIHLADSFDIVWTFEPDQDNFDCMLRNVNGIKNVHMLKAALGKEKGYCELERDPKNAGAHYMKPGDRIPVLTIDELNLPACDLIVLDIEGAEPRAIEGAMKTIEAFHPILMMEDKGLSERVGLPKGWTDAIPGYDIVQRIHRDVILA